MTSVQGYGCSRKEHLFLALFNLFPLFELDNELSNLPIGSLRLNPLNFPAAKPSIYKYTKKHFQRIFKIVFEAQALATSKKP